MSSLTLRINRMAFDNGKMREEIVSSVRDMHPDDKRRRAAG